jgi:hypothetical protein
MELIPHPACRPKAVERIAASILRDQAGLMIEFDVWGDLRHVRFPQEVSPARRDNLWQTTCFEAFLRPPGGKAYFEINMSPSGEWASYRFDDYRVGMTEAPIIAVGEPFYLDDGGIFEMSLNFEWSDKGQFLGSEPWAMALSAVIEEEDGRKSYWALGHGDGPPDFHNPACFTASLAPIAAA